MVSEPISEGRDAAGRTPAEALPSSTAPSTTDPSVPPVKTATLQPPALASRFDILDLVARELEADGVAGETRTAKLLYLVATSRLLDRPCSTVVKGPSAAGKSYLVERVLDLFPPDAYYALSAMSERALAYDRAPLAHRMLVVYEAAGLSGEIASYLMRSLLSEGRINYLTVVLGKAGPEPKRIVREGPTGLITTTTAVALHPENETRLLTLTVSDTPAQTRSIMLAHAQRSRASRDHRAWHELQTWLATTTIDVVVPYAATLADAIPPVTVRLRRDFAMLITLIRAHALLHQLRRARDDRGRVVANFDDYAGVRPLVADLLADAAERTVSATVRETVAAVGALADADDPLGEGISVTALATQLELDKSSALRRARTAISRGYLKNLELRRGRPARLVTGDALPADTSLLPICARLEWLHGCGAAWEEGDIPVELDYPASAWGPTDDDGHVIDDALRVASGVVIDGVGAP